MKRILSWIVLYLISELTGIVNTLILRAAGYLVVLINELNTLGKLIFYFIGGATLLSFIFVPILSGATFAVIASETIRESKKGLRYIIFSIYMFLANAVFFIVNLNKGAFTFNVILMCIYYIILLIAGISKVKERM